MVSARFCGQFHCRLCCKYAAPRCTGDRELHPRSEKLTLSIRLRSTNIVRHYGLAAGKLTLHCSEVGPDELLQQVLRSVTISAHQKGLELLYDNRVQLPERVTGDPARLQQVLVNLLGNAIKFTESGEVKLSVVEVAQSADSALIHRPSPTQVWESRTNGEAAFSVPSFKQTARTRAPMGIRG